MEGLRRLAEFNGNGFLFSVDGGATPISRYYFNRYLSEALEGIGIDEEEQKKRKLTPHAWRYFLNTNLRVKGVPDAKVQAVTGHKAQHMTEKYTQFYTEEFTEVRSIQDMLLAEGEQGEAEGGEAREKWRPNLGDWGTGGKHRRGVNRAEVMRGRSERSPGRKSRP
jgi:hypothetical protein